MGGRTFSGIDFGVGDENTILYGRYLEDGSFIIDAIWTHRPLPDADTPPHRDVNTRGTPCPTPVPQIGRDSDETP